MSIAILISVNDGIVLAADSASTLTLMQPAGVPGQQSPVALNVYNNANKIANLYKGAPIGCVAYGAGSIGNESISTLLKDFRAEMTDGTRRGFDGDAYTVEGVANGLRDFLIERVQRMPEVAAGVPAPALGILLGGYSAGASLGEGWMIQIENGQAKDPVRLRDPHEVGITWGGEGEAISRLVLGFSPKLPQILQSVVSPGQPGAVEQLVSVVRTGLQAPIVFAPMPIQDAIDLAEFLVHTAVQFSRFTPGPQAVGGPIEIAAITKHEGFKWIRRKHYFHRELNREAAYDDPARRE